MQIPVAVKTSTASAAVVVTKIGGCMQQLLHIERNFQILVQSLCRSCFVSPEEDSLIIDSTNFLLTLGPWSKS